MLNSKAPPSGRKRVQKVPKRVEYQKYVRLKLEHTIHRKLFGLTDNIVLIGEEDIVLQREFRIDFVLQKIDGTIYIVGIFSYFREYNLLEFKSINDRLDMTLVDKYIGQLFWWLFAKRRDAQKGAGRYIRNDEVTLTIITVGNPRNTIKELKDYLGEKGFETVANGIYQWEVMGVLVRLIVINHLDVTREHYGWLIFSEGEKYNEYKEKLVGEIKQDDSLQVYLELLNEVEKEGKERMADEIIRRILADMPIERKEGVLVGLPDSDNILRRILADKTVEEKEKILSGLPDSDNVVQRILSGHPDSDDVLLKIFSDMPVERQRQLLRMFRKVISDDTPYSEQDEKK